MISRSRAVEIAKGYLGEQRLTHVWDPDSYTFVTISDPAVASKVWMIAFDEKPPVRKQVVVCIVQVDKESGEAVVVSEAGAQG